MRGRSLPIACATLVAIQIGGCAYPYRGPKTLGALGAALLGAGGATWVMGDRRDQGVLATTGAVTTAIGAAMVMAAGGWMAASVSCKADPDCAQGETCREIPAPPGGIPYRQCMPR